MRILFGTIGLAITVGVSLAGQVSQDALKFEVASIKQNKSGEERVSGGFMPGGNYRVTNYSLRSLIAAAYLRPQINPNFLIAGGPEWIDADRFDVEAKAATEFPAGPDGPTAPRRVMLQNLLAERFALKVHHETKQGDVYAIAFARMDKQTGPNFRRSTVDCATTPGTASNPCAVKVGPGSISSAGMTFAQLLGLLSRFVDRVVIDTTGLTDRFEIRLTWTPAPGEWVAPPLPDIPAPTPDGPSLFTAMQEQLGLKLQPQKGPIDWLMIDHAEKPAQN